ncbi:hypothetical protein FOA52_011497 [Chlamydomonas sp. UWO 241]|nr:hypothetical protein FOA52_011497 [Chlamydomonas sp. UWO 241]
MLADPEGRLLEKGSPLGVEVYRDNSGRRITRTLAPAGGGGATECVELKDGSTLERSAPSSSNRFFITQNLSDLAWAFADQGIIDEVLFSRIARRATTDVTHFSKTSLVDIAFGFASAGHYDAELFTAIEEFALPILPDFGPAYMSELLWSMAKLGHRPGEAFVSAAMEVTWNKWERVTSDRNWLAKTIWALLRFDADKLHPNHQLLAAFNDALGEADMARDAAAVGGAVGGAVDGGSRATSAVGGGGDALESAIINTEDQAVACIACMASAEPRDAWSCDACLALDAGVQAECFTCLQGNPYTAMEQPPTNYGWACSACGGIPGADLRQACFFCIDSFGTVAKEEDLCLCVDLTRNVSITDEILFEGTLLNAMERSCYYPWLDNGVELPIPWGNGPGAECVRCMRAVSPDNLVVTQPINKMFACSRYCQDSTLVRTDAEGDSCSQCVQDPRVIDPWACQNCMLERGANSSAASSSALARRECFECVKDGLKVFSTQDWACGRCANFRTVGQRWVCYGCLGDSLKDPQTCLEEVANGTITPYNTTWATQLYDGLSVSVSGGILVRGTTESSVVDLGIVNSAGEVTMISIPFCLSDDDDCKPNQACHLFVCGDPLPAGGPCTRDRQCRSKYCGNAHALIMVNVGPTDTPMYGGVLCVNCISWDDREGLCGPGQYCQQVTWTCKNKIQGIGAFKDCLYGQMCATEHCGIPGFRDDPVAAGRCYDCIWDEHCPDVGEQRFYCETIDVSGGFTDIGKCKPKLIPGSGCFRNNECFDDLCVYSTCGARVSGDACEGPGDCGDDLKCGTPGITETLAGFCHACTFDEHCDVEQYCDYTPWGNYGDCLAKKSSGSCDRNSQCTDGRCVWAPFGTCGKRDNSGSCQEGDDCKSSVCGTPGITESMAGLCHQCIWDKHCMNNEYCQYSPLVGTYGECEAKKLDGQWCDSKRKCATGVCPYGDIGAGTCGRRSVTNDDSIRHHYHCFQWRDRKETCQNTPNCKDGLTCGTPGITDTLAGMCHTCIYHHHCTSRQYCQYSPFVSTYGQCEEKKLDGAWCDSEKKCLTNICPYGNIGLGTCGARDSGESCENRNQCQWPLYCGTPGITENLAGFCHQCTWDSHCPGQVCGYWPHNNYGVCYPTPDCFPGDATVQVLGRGRVRMDALEYGDSVLSVLLSTQQKVYRQMYFFGHRDNASTLEYVHIATSTGATLRLSSTHMLPMCTSGCSDGAQRVVFAHAYARDVAVGDLVLVNAAGNTDSNNSNSSNNNGGTLGGGFTLATVERVWSQHARGLFNPYVHVAFTPIYWVFLVLGPSLSSWIAHEGMGLADSGTDSFAVFLASVGTPMMALHVCLCPGSETLICQLAVMSS